MENIFYGILNWIREDWKSHPIRCGLEIFAWFLSITCSFVMMLTVPTPPFLILYPLFILQCGIFCWAAYTRKSSGMIANYSLLVFIDTIAFIRLII